MRPAAWRTIFLTLCAAGALFCVASFVDQAGLGGSPWYGIWGGYFDGSPQPYRMTFRGVDSGGPADRAGLREGDLIDVRVNTPRERLSMVGQPLAGRPITFRVERGSLRTTATVLPWPPNLSRFWNYVLWEFTNLWLLLFAAVIAWRRPYVDNNLLLAAVLACAAIGFNAEAIFWGLPSAWAYVGLALLGQVLPLSVALWAALAASFARPLSPARRIALGLCYAFVALAIVTGDGTPDRAVGIAPLVALTTLWFDPTRFIGVIWTVPAIAGALMAIVSSAFTIAAARGIDRQRAVWLLAPLAAFGILAASSVALHVLNYAGILVVGRVYSIVAIVTPLVLTYVALNRRLIDIGFVLNRTVVFALVSSIVIGAFVLVEWAAGAWLVSASHTTSVVVGMVVALALGLSLRYIHGYVDRVVDNVLFRKRHDDEAALRRFAHESSYITDAATLPRGRCRTCTRIRMRSTRTSSSAMDRRRTYRVSASVLRSARTIRR